MKKLLLACIIVLTYFATMAKQVSAEEATVVLSLPSAGTYVLQVVIDTDGKVVVKQLPVVKVAAVPVTPDTPTPVTPKTEIQKIASDTKFAQLKPFFPQISAVYAEKQPEEIKSAVAEILKTQELKDLWAVLGGRLSEYYDNLNPQPDVEDFMKRVSEDLKKL